MMMVILSVTKAVRSSQHGSTLCPICTNAIIFEKLLGLRIHFRYLRASVEPVFRELSVIIVSVKGMKTFWIN
jgi:hypothetical protein